MIIKARHSIADLVVGDLHQLGRAGAAGLKLQTIRPNGFKRIGIILLDGVKTLP